jgi:predicted Zn finger-like uncharacterized protein
MFLRSAEVRLKFVCDKCGTGYTIPDEKVAGRILKIRCKQCREVVEVMGPPPPESALALEPALPATPGRTAIERAVLATAGELEHRLVGVHLPRQISGVKHQRELDSAVGGDDEQWFAAIKGRRVGPMSRAELLVCARRGTLHERSYVWRPGMASWRRINEDPELSFLTEVFSKRQMLASAQRVAAVLQPGVFAGMFAPDSVHEQPTQPPTAARPPLVRENSDWFVLDERSQSALWERSEPVIEVPATPLMTGTHLLPGKRPLWTALTVLALCGLFGVGVLSVAWQQRDWLVEATAPLADAVTDATADTRAAALVAQVRQALAADQGDGVRWPVLNRSRQRPRQQTAGLSVPRQHATPIAAGDLGAAGPMTTERETIMRSDAVQLPDADAVDTWVVQQLKAPALDLGTPVAAAAPESTVPVDLTADDVVRIVAARRPQLETCYTSVLKQHSELSGTVEATLVINRQGRVGSVTVSGDGEAARELAVCMQQHMRQWTFQRPTTELEVVMPIRLNQVQ